MLISPLQLEDRPVFFCVCGVCVCVRQWAVVLLYSAGAAPWVDKSSAQD